MATEKWLIDANALKMTMFALTEYLNNESIFIDVIIDAIDSYDPVDAVEVVHGRWEQVQRWATKAKYRCSVCGREIMSATKLNIKKYPYCHCGAKMDGDGNG